MPNILNPTSHDLATAAALEKIYARLGNLEVTIAQSPQTKPPLVVGEGQLQYVIFDHATGVKYPPELQPQITPTKNIFQYHQLNYPERLFKISGEFAASGIPQVGESALNSYNSGNGTSFGTRPIDKIITPIQNTSGRDIPLAFVCENDWRNINSGDVIDHVEPLHAVWHKGTNEIELKFHKGTFSVPFSSGLTWDIRLSFWAIDYLDIEG